MEKKKERDHVVWGIARRLAICLDPDARRSRVVWCGERREKCKKEKSQTCFEVSLLDPEEKSSFLSSKSCWGAHFRNIDAVRTTRRTAQL